MRRSLFLALFALVLVGCSGNDNSVEDPSPLGRSIVSADWHYRSPAVYSIDNATGNRTLFLELEKVIGVSGDGSVLAVSSQGEPWDSSALKFITPTGAEILTRDLRSDHTNFHLLDETGSRIAYDLGGSVAIEPIGSIGTTTITFPDQVDIKVPMSFSKDGSKLLVLNWRPQRPSLFLAPSTGGMATAIQGTDRAAWATLSPDGSKVVFVSDGEIRQVPVTGGTPVTLAVDEARNPRFTPDGKWIVYNRGMTDHQGYPQNLGLYRIPATGGTPTLISESPDELYVVID